MTKRKSSGEAPGLFFCMETASHKDIGACGRISFLTIPGIIRGDNQTPLILAYLPNNSSAFLS